MSDSGAQQLLSVGEVAKRLGLPTHTIRRWAEYHREHLSETANPEDVGTARRFTEKDVQTLQAAQQMRAKGLTVAVINDRLSGLSIGEIEQTEPTGIEPAQDAPTGDVVSGALIARVDALLALGERVQALEAQRWRIDVVFVAVAAFVAGLVVGLAVWWFQ
jgi:DNA-binding transcriptional MerR regulator